MKKTKLLIPLLTITGTAMAVTPIVSSCSQGEKEEEHFTLTSGEKTKTVESPEISGQSTFVFTTTDTLTKDTVKLIESIAVITKKNSYITLTRCWASEYDLQAKTITVIVSYSIDPEAFEYKKEQGKVVDPEEVQFNMTIHNGTWTQTIEGFSIKAKRKISN